MARDNPYSTVVVWVKVTLPLVALALLSSLFLLSGAPDPDAALPYAEVDIDEIIREQRVTEPRFAGVLGENQALVLRAQAVSTGTGDSESIRAEAVDGRLDLSTTEFLTLDAAFGDFDMAGQVATLTNGVELQSSLGYMMESDQVVVALNQLDIRAPTAVHITGPGLDLTADTMTLAGPEGQTILRFTGSVRVIYDPNS